MSPLRGWIRLIDKSPGASAPGFSRRVKGFIFFLFGEGIATDSSRFFLFFKALAVGGGNGWGRSDARAIGTSNEQAKRLSVTQRHPEMTKSFYLGRPGSGADDIFGSISARRRRRIGCIVDCFQDCVRRCLETNSGTRRQDGSKPGAKVISKQTVFRRRYCVPLIGMAGAVGKGNGKGTREDGKRAELRLRDSRPLASSATRRRPSLQRTAGKHFGVIERLVMNPAVPQCGGQTTHRRD